MTWEVRVEAAEQLFNNYEAKLADAQRKADLMRAELATVKVGERSKDGQIAVEVDHAGNLIGLQIGPNARGKPELADEILRVVRLAQSKLAEAVQSGVPAISGTETMSELVHQLHDAYPEPEPDGYQEGGGGYGDRAGRQELDFAPEDETPPPPAPAPEPPRPAPRKARESHDDDYFGDGNFLR